MKKEKKTIISIILIVVAVLSLAGCSGKAKVPFSASDFHDKSITDVVEALEQAGFTSINTQALDDIDSNSKIKDGAVETVTIDSSNDYSANDKFDSGVPVDIVYHSIPRIKSPISSADIQDMSSTDLADLFEKAGFENISVEEVYDLDPDESDGDFKNEVLINGVNVFEKEDELVFDAEIKVICHRQYVKHTVNVSINFIGNWFFDKYDVDFLVNGAKNTTLEHGKDAEFSLRLKEGINVFSFISSDDSSVKGEIELNVSSDVDVEYRISCYSDEISVNVVYTDFKSELAWNEAKITCSESTFYSENYETVVKTLKEFGFTNITTVPKYDIYFGITKTGSVSDVAINGNDNYKRGDVFNKDVEIVVTYHMPYNEDPEYQKTHQESNSNTTNKTTVYSTNDLETAKKGNTGVFAYRSNNKNATYYTYYIIDFDEGYVYRFVDGNGDGMCDRVKIDSGDLNEYVLITYHDGNDVWQEGLHFKWKRQPDILIHQDNDGFETEFITTNLEHALAIRSTKTIYDY